MNLGHIELNVAYMWIDDQHIGVWVVPVHLHLNLSNSEYD